MVWLAFFSLALCSLRAFAADANLPQLAPNLAPQPAPELFVQASPLTVVPVVHVDPIPFAEPGTTVVPDPTPDLSPKQAPDLAPEIAPKLASEVVVKVKPQITPRVPALNINVQPANVDTVQVDATAGPQPAPALADPKEIVKKTLVVTAAEPTVADPIGVADTESGFVANTAANAETAAKTHTLSSTTQAPSSETSTKSVLLATLIPFFGMVIIVPVVVLIMKWVALSRRAARVSRENFGHYVRTRV